MEVGRDHWHRVDPFLTEGVAKQRAYINSVVPVYVSIVIRRYWRTGSIEKIAGRGGQGVFGTWYEMNKHVCPCKPFHILHIARCIPKLSHRTNIIFILVVYSLDTVNILPYVSRPTNLMSRINGKKTQSCTYYCLFVPLFAVLFASRR